MSNFSAFNWIAGLTSVIKKLLEKRHCKNGNLLQTLSRFFFYLSLQFSYPYDGSIKNIILSKNELVLIVVTSCNNLVKVRFLFLWYSV